MSENYFVVKITDGSGKWSKHGFDDFQKAIECFDKSIADYKRREKYPKVLYTYEIE
jgi:hypothetical protein